MAKAGLRLKDLLTQNRPALATFTTLKGARTAQVLAHTGLDAVIVDCEHGNVDDADMHDKVQAIAGAGISPIVRIPAATMPIVKRALDTGAHGILVPMVNAALDANAILSYAKFPPTGIRGQGGPFACFGLGLATPAEYVAQANEKLLTIAQIETAAGVRNIDEICRVEGIDVVLIGPNDLALALLGYMPAQGTEEVYLEAIDKVVASARKHGKKSGIVVVDGKGAKTARERFDLVVLSADVRALQGWYKHELRIAQS